jgi:F-type H+-transporting ATPase subunit epsilon
MTLKVLALTEVVLDEEVTKVSAEAENGGFTLLPRHIDFVTALAPGLLSLEKPDGSEEFLAVDEGILVKVGPDVLVSTRQAVRGADLGTLYKTVEERFRAVDEEERQARAALTRLEADMVRRFSELREI